MVGLFECLAANQMVSSKYENIIKLLNDQIKMTDFKKVKTIFVDDKSSKIVIDILKSYIAYYIFVCIGYFYEDKSDIFTCFRITSAIAKTPPIATINLFILSIKNPIR